MAIEEKLSTSTLLTGCSKCVKNWTKQKFETGMLFKVSQQQQPQQNTEVNNNWKKKSLIIYAISSKSTFIDCVTSFISSTFCCELTRTEMNINKIYTSRYLTLLWSYSDNNFLLFIEHYVTMLLEIHFSIPVSPSTR